MWTTPTTSAVNGYSRLPESTMPSQPISTGSLATTAAPPDHGPNWQDYTYPTELTQRPSEAAPGPVLVPPPHRIPVFEYQWGDELVSRLSRLPPRSNFGGKFAIIADPGVDNAMRAQIFAVQLHSQGVPISYVASSALSFAKPHLLPSSTGKDIPHRAPRPLSTHTRCSFPVSVKTGVLAGSSSRSVTTLRILTACLASASAWRSITPPLAETSW